MENKEKVLDAANPPEEEMDYLQTTQILRERGIRLELDEAKSGLMAGPPELLTEEIRAAIRANKDELMRPELFKEAVRHFDEYVLEREGSRKTHAFQAASDAFVDASEEVQDAWDASLEEFKDELRQWVRTGLRAYKKAKREADKPDCEAQPELTADGPRRAESREGML